MNKASVVPVAPAASLAMVTAGRGGSRGQDAGVSRTYPKSHTSPQQPSAFGGGMNHSASLSAPTPHTRRPGRRTRKPARRTRTIVLVSLAILGVAIAAFILQRPLVAAAPSSPSTSPAEVGKSTRPTSRPTQPARPSKLGVSDGVIPHGVAVSVFDDEIPAVGKLDPDLLDALRRAATDAKAHGVEFRVNSGWRSPEYQERLLQDAVARYGSRKEAARWVSTPQTSAHVKGEAVDIGPPYAAAWLSRHGAAYGLCQIYRNEPWHYELRPGAVDDGCPPLYADPTRDPRMRS